MKRNRINRFTAAVLCLATLLSAAVFSGCRKEKKSGTTETDLLLVSGGTSDYVILYPESASDNLIRAAELLQNAIQTRTGARLQVQSVRGSAESEREILIGEMDARTVTEDVGKALRVNDYTVTAIGTRLLLVGGSESATVSAVRKFINEKVNTETSADLSVAPGEWIHKDGTYQVPALKLGETDISRYRIVYSTFYEDFYRESVEMLQSRIVDLCGVRIRAVPSTEPAEEFELLFGDCSRSLSDGLKPKGKNFILTGDGKSLAFAAKDKLAATWGTCNLIDQYLPAESNGDISISLLNGTIDREAAIGKPLIDGADLRVMSSNVLFLNSNNGGQRAPLLKDIYMEYYPDVIGLQECDSSGHALIVSGLSAYYSVACVSVGTSTTKSHTPILYRSDRCELLASGSYQFDQQAEGSKTKILSWAVFRHLKTDKTFAVINVHCAVVTETIRKRYEEQGLVAPSNKEEGVAWRLDNCRQILEQVDLLFADYGTDLPILIMGDMNATVNEESIQTLDARAELDDCMDLATVSRTKGKASWHDLGKAPPNGNPLDHMFVTKDTVQVYTHYLNATPEALKSSDHCQLICEIAWK